MSKSASKIGRCLLPELLRDKGMTQVQLADRIGRPRQQITNYVIGERRMSLELARTIAQTLGCHIDDLYEWYDDKGSK